jgi:hypothetical protein
MSIDVRLRAEWTIGTGYRYDVLLGDEVIVSRSRDPEHDAARVLRARGLRGRLRTIDFTKGRHRMTLDIEKAAGLRVVERDRGGITVEPYLPLSSDDVARLRPPGTHRARDIPSEPVIGTGQPVEAAGGEGADVGTASTSRADRAGRLRPSLTQGRPTRVETVKRYRTSPPGRWRSDRGSFVEHSGGGLTMGRPAHLPTTMSRRNVEALAGYGVP